MTIEIASSSLSETSDVLPQPELELIDAYWRAATYLSVGQIYLLDNPLLREPLKLKHGRYIREHGQDMPEIANWVWPGQR